MTDYDWKCTIPGRPTSKGNSSRILRAGARRFVAPSAAAVRAEKSARAALKKTAPHVPFDGPLIVSFRFVFKIPAKSGHIPGMPCMRKIDRGNLLKLAEDAGNGLIWQDDSQICAGNVSKVWGHEDKTEITLRTLQPLSDG